MFGRIVCKSVLLILTVRSQDLTSLINVDSLSELPLESLLNVKRHISEFDENVTDVLAQENASTTYDKLPEALPLLGTQKIRKKEGYVPYGDDDYKKDDKKKSITTIFQLSVTTLAFLAFGGYLLYLVTVAIKGKNYNYMYDPNATQVMQAMINAQLNRRKKLRRRRPIRVGGNLGNLGFNNNYNKKTHKNLRVKRAEKLDYSLKSDTLYYALAHLCEGYAKFYETDYANLLSCHLGNTCSKIN